LNSLIGECGGLLYLIQLVMYYDAPVHLKYRQAVGENKQTEVKQQQNPIDWTNKIKLGTTYVLNTMLKQTQYIPSITVLQTLLTDDLCQILHDKPSEFVKTISSNTVQVQTVKQKLEPYITQQLQQIEQTHKWQQYIDHNVTL
jgi:hypothetical protein